MIPPVAFATRLARVPLTVLAVWAACAALLPTLMAQYEAFSISSGLGRCVPTGTRLPGGARVPTCDTPLATFYQQPLELVILEATVRSLVLLVGAAILAAVLGTLVGFMAAALRRRAFASGAILGVTAAVAAIPSFFVVLLLQMAVIFAGQAAGRRVLPVFGFGLDEHLVLPLATVAIPAVAMTAQLVGARASELLDSDFVTTAHAKGLLPSWIGRVHLVPHLRPLVVESVGSGLRISVASLPIVEYLFLWNGIGYVALRAIAATDAVALTASALVLAAFFGIVSLVADARRS